MSEQSPYPRSALYRAYRNTIDAWSKKSRAYHEARRDNEEFGMTQTLRIMFGNDVRPELLSEQEQEDVLNFIEFAAKRVAAGAVLSKSFHERIQRRGAEEVRTAMRSYAPSDMSDHDAMHAMWAYVRSGSKSFLPAYTQTEKIGDEYADPAAILEERYVNLFENGFSDLRAIFAGNLDVRDADDPVEKAVECWEEESFADGTSSVPYPEYAQLHRHPELVAIARSVYADTQKETPDPLLPFREFQRIMKPVLERLRKAREKGEDFESLAV